MGSGYIKRAIEETILKAGKSFPCVVVYGPRQVGKSTTIDHLFGDSFNKVTMDDPDDRLIATANPKLFLERYGCPLVIDEIQKAPTLLDEIKKAIDAERLRLLKTGEDRKLMYVLTGSNRYELQQGISDSLAGRCGIIEMASFMQGEKESREITPFAPTMTYWIGQEKAAKSRKTRREVFESIFMGGMPDVCTGVAERDIYYRAYVNTYLEKDVMKLIEATSELQFRNFLSIVALRTAQELHYDEIAAEVGIDVRTCKRWISILQTSGIVYLLQPYMANFSKRIIKAPKMYFMDTGLCAYLCKWPNAEMLENCAMSGAFLETFVVSEIIKNCFAFGIDANVKLYYYRDIDQKEIDLLYVEGADVYPIEIKKGITPTNPTKHFKVMKSLNVTLRPGIVFDNTDRVRPLGEEAFCVPFSLL